MFNSDAKWPVLLAFILGASAGMIATVFALKDEATIVATKERVVTKIVTKTAIEHRDRIRVVSHTIIEKVPVYVTKYVDRQYPVPVGFIRLHDAAVRSEIPGTAGGIDASASSVKISEVARVVTENYGMCQEWRQELVDLQSWVRQEKAITNGTSTQTGD